MDFMFLVGVLNNVYTNAPELRHSTSLTRFDARSLAPASYPITRVTDLNCDREHLHIYIRKDTAEFIFRNRLYRDVVWTIENLHALDRCDRQRQLRRSGRCIFDTR